MEKISLKQVKQALQDGRFRDKLPLELREEVAGFLQNPGCPCNLPLYRKILKDCRSNLKEYYPNKEIADEDEEIRNLSQNHWFVINCKVNELESKLKSLGPGRKQIAVARYQDEITVIVNDLDLIL